MTESKKITISEREAELSSFNCWVCGQVPQVGEDMWIEEDKNGEEIALCQSCHRAERNND